MNRTEARAKIEKLRRITQARGATKAEEEEAAAAIRRLMQAYNIDELDGYSTLWRKSDPTLDDLIAKDFERAIREVRETLEKEKKRVENFFM